MLLRNLQNRLRPTPHQDVVPQDLQETMSRKLYAPAAEAMPALPSIKAVLDQQDRIPDVSRVGGNEEGYMHVSSLINVCTRREVLQAEHAAAPAFNQVTGAHRLVWAYGRAAEKHVRDTYARGAEERGEARLWGRWECVCGTTHNVGVPSAIRCDVCTHLLTEYKEVAVKDETRKLVGNPDMPLALADDWFVIGEVKSMNAEEWKTLEAPKPDHILQAGTYRRIRHDQGWKMHSHIIVLYAVKEFRFGSPYKEFTVDVTTGVIASQIDGLLDAAEEIASARRNGIIPPRTVCQSASNPVAKKCPTVGLCFNLPSE